MRIYEFSMEFRADSRRQLLRAEPLKMITTTRYVRRLWVIHPWGPKYGSYKEEEQ